ncbi:LuxR C-terminal-related transcriptional regulator [Terracoccus luteus]|uniref:DNA-binding NarL/FixJ family response regulator n=1 Tax=Terracoccus luteus TaxID=53356 RepID=A0A839PS81_9MICO|nr:response regulator transcription factor [Terracoccus luteus]MBB2985654.1 DNA-binding NarL/FixJ family response regulator [Terracoccus luteus]MCP2171306.1 DNA-binding NarL/FixJ family response regulator [Terracoccus luteus]
MTDPRVIRVVLVDDHHMFRTGVRAELSGLADRAPFRLEIVGEAGAVESATAVITEQQPDVVLLDVHLPGGDGHGGADVIRACAGVHARPAPTTATTAATTAVNTNAPAAATNSGAKAPEGPAVRFLALSVSDAAEDVIAVIRAGARGYVTKTINAEELLTAIGRVAEGDAVFSPRLAGFVLDAFGATAGEVAEIDEELDRLSAREREVMRLIARGYQYKEVAKELFISVKTVETHVSSVLRKLQLSSRHELTAWAMGRRLL